MGLPKIPIKEKKRLHQERLMLLLVSPIATLKLVCLTFNLHVHFNYSMYLFSFSACLQGKLLANQKDYPGVEKVAEAARSILGKKMQDEARQRKF